MGERLFLFVQMEFPWELGPADGRYLLRGHIDIEPERVVILETVGAARRHGRLAARRRSTVEPEPKPATVPTTRVTVIDPVPVSAERQARAWLTQLDAERETQTVASVVNRVLFAHRLATADPHVRELSSAQALAIRAGWGEGEQVAYGQWSHARELRVSASARRRRTSVLRPQERLAGLLGARERSLLCEELALRARLDLDQGRGRLAAIELDCAYTAAIVELPAQRRLDLDARIAELRQLHPGVSAAARVAIEEGATASGAWTSAGGPGVASGSQPNDQPGTTETNADIISHALARLEAALRARTAGSLT